MLVKLNQINEGKYSKLNNGNKQTNMFKKKKGRKKKKREEESTIQKISPGFVELVQC